MSATRDQIKTVIAEVCRRRVSYESAFADELANALLALQPAPNRPAPVTREQILEAAPEHEHTAECRWIRAPMHLGPGESLTREPSQPAPDSARPTVADVEDILTVHLYCGQDDADRVCGSSAAANEIAALYAPAFTALEHRLAATVAQYQAAQKDLDDYRTAAALFEAAVQRLQVRATEAEGQVETLARELAEAREARDDAQAMRCLRADIRSSVDDFHEGKEPFNHALHRYIGNLRAQVATLTAALEAIAETSMGGDGKGSALTGEPLPVLTAHEAQRRAAQALTPTPETRDA